MHRATSFSKSKKNSQAQASSLLHFEQTQTVVLRCSNVALVILSPSHFISFLIDWITSCLALTNVLYQFTGR